MIFRLKSGKVFGSGRVTKSGSELKQGANGKSVYKLGVQVDEQKTDTGWDKEFSNLVAFGKTAEDMPTLYGGETVFFTGTEKTREYNGKTYADVIIDHLLTNAGESASPPRTSLEPADIPGDDDGDLPF